MLEEDIDDTHLCIRCSTTIVGLDNYIQHRKNNCPRKTNTSQIIHDPVQHNHHNTHYESFDFVEGQNTSFSKQSDENDKANKSISENYDLPYDLGADVFFQSLELQSSSKRHHTSSSLPTTIQSTTTRNTTRTSSPLTPSGKGSSTVGKLINRKTENNPNLNNSDEWISPATSDNSDNLMKAVRDISGTKKCYSIFKLIPFQHCSPEQSDDGRGDEDDEIDEEEVDILDDDEDYLTVPANHTGGKWKPESCVRNISSWENDPHWSEYKSTANKDLYDFENDLMNPPPDHTKGKWVPGTKIVKLNYKEDDDIEKIYSDQYWCNTCNRKLASKILYEKHLKSSLHLKRAKPEQELEKAAVQTMSERLKKPSVYLNTSMYSTEIENVEIQPILNEEDSQKPNKRKRRKYFIKCNTCNTRLPKYLMGKHLISHFHYRRMVIDPTKSLEMILENIHRIVHQSPFQCQPCRFYCNTEDEFIAHWNSNAHLDLTEGPGKFWCTFCKFECEDNNQMRRHLLGSEHKEVILAINRSVPIIIKKKTVIECLECKHIFRYNVELRKHAQFCSKVPLGSASNDYQSKFPCDICDAVSKSQLALQKHKNNKHSTKFYFCSTCKIESKNPVDSKKHRNTSKHKISVQRLKNKQNISKKCKICFEIFQDLNSLKNHIMEIHPDETSSCSYCGAKFAICQDLGRHIRDKICRKTVENEIEQTTQSNEYNQNIEEQTKEYEIIKTYQISEVNYNNEEDNISDQTESSKAIEILEITIQNPQSYLDTGTIIPYSSEETEKSDLMACQMCEFKTPSTAELLFHELLHNLPSSIDKNTKINCPICSKMFRKNSLRLHLRLHTNERLYECSHCKMSFVRKYNLKEHVNNIHLKLKTKVKKSNSIVKPITPLKCNICDKIYNTTISFKHHLYTHKQRDERFKCNVVDCIFIGRSSHDLKMHQTTHSDEKTFNCDFEGCTYKGKNAVNLKKHQKIHSSSVKKFQCSECNFETKYSTHLKRHMAIHSGEKAHKCPHCSYACGNKENLRKHILRTIKHKGRFLYECKLCDQSDGNRFKTNFEKEYRVHLVLFHKIEKDLNELLKA